MIHIDQIQSFVCYVDRTTAEGGSFGLGMGLPTVPNLAMSVLDSLSTCGATIPNPASPLVVGDTTQLVLQPESWYNIISTFHKGTIQVFVNGKLISTKSGASSTVPLCPNAGLLIGAWWDTSSGSGSETLNGKMDEVRLYNRVLNSNEVAALAREFK